MKAHPLTALAATLTAGLSACSLYDPDMTAAWEEPLPSTSRASGEDDSPMPAALFADPADEEEANLLALEREPIPILQIRKPQLPAPIITDFASVPEAIEAPLVSAIPVPVPASKEPQIVQPPVIIAGSGVPDPGSIDEPPSDLEVAEIQTETIVPAESDPFGTTTLTLDPIIDSPPSIDYSGKLSEESTPMRTE